MKRTTIACWLSLAATVAHARDVVVRPDSTSCQNISRVTLAKAGSAPVQLTRDANGDYVATEPQPPTPTAPLDYTIVAVWKDPLGALTLSQFYLWAPAQEDPVISVLCEHAGMSKAALLALPTGPDYDSVTTRFQMARDFFRHLPPQNTDVTLLALKIWFDAAYRMSRDYSFFAQDPELSDLVGQKGDAALKSMLQQYELIPWRAASKIQTSYKAGDLDTAKALNDHFLIEFNGLPAEKKAALVKYYGINGALLRNNADAISARASDK